MLAVCKLAALLLRLLLRAAQPTERFVEQMWIRIKPGISYSRRKLAVELLKHVSFRYNKSETTIKDYLGHGFNGLRADYVQEVMGILKVWLASSSKRGRQSKSSPKRSKSASTVKRRGRGRPKGSKNKPKAEVGQEKSVSTPGCSDGDAEDEGRKEDASDADNAMGEAKATEKGRKKKRSRAACAERPRKTGGFKKTKEEAVMLPGSAATTSSAARLRSWRISRASSAWTSSIA